MAQRVHSDHSARGVYRVDPDAGHFGAMHLGGLLGQRVEHGPAGGLGGNPNARQGAIASGMGCSAIWPLFV